MSKRTLLSLFLLLMGTVGIAQTPRYTVASLPPASYYPNSSATVTDGATTTDCSVGGGGYTVKCTSNGTTWVGSATGGGGGGGGTVTGFTAGNLSPFFTTTVTNGSSTPNLAFSFANAGANTLFGNNTSSSAAPNYYSANAFSDTILGLGTTGLVKRTGTNAYGVAVVGTDYQLPIALTTTGLPGSATFTQSGNGYTLNIPNYASGFSPLHTYTGVFITGDSICFGVGATATQYGFAQLIAARIGNWTNVCRQGDQAADQALLFVYPNLNPLAYNNRVIVHEIGANDANVDATTYSGNCTGCRNNFQHALLSSLLWESIPNTQKIIFGFKPSSVTTTGTWVTDSTLQTNLGLQTVTASSTLTYTELYAGTSHYITWMAYDGDTSSATYSCTPVGGGATVISDTLNAYGYLTNSTVQLISTQNGTTKTTFSNRYTTTTAQQLTCTITPTVSTGNPFTLVWAGTGPSLMYSSFGQQSVNAPTVYITGVLHQQNNVNDTTTGAYDTIVKTQVAQLFSDGLADFIVDGRSAVSATTDMSSTAVTLPNGSVVPGSSLPGLHPNGGLCTGENTTSLCGGHADLANEFFRAMLPAVPPLSAMFTGSPATISVLPTINNDQTQNYKIDSGFCYFNVPGNNNVQCEALMKPSVSTGLISSGSLYKVHINSASSSGGELWCNTTGLASDLYVFYGSCAFMLDPSGFIKLMKFNDTTGVGQNTFLQTVGSPQGSGAVSASTLDLLPSLTYQVGQNINGGVNLGKGSAAGSAFGFASMVNSGQTDFVFYGPSQNFDFCNTGGVAVSVYSGFANCGIHASTATGTLSANYYAGTQCSIAAATSITPSCGNVTITGATTTITTMLAPATFSATASSGVFYLTTTSPQTFIAGTGVGGFAVQFTTKPGYTYPCTYARNSTTVWNCGESTVAYTPVSVTGLTGSTLLTATAYSNHVECNGSITPLTLPSSPIVSMTFNITNISASSSCTVSAASAIIGNATLASSATISSGASLQLTFTGTYWRSE